MTVIWEEIAKSDAYKAVFGGKNTKSDACKGDLPEEYRVITRPIWRCARIGTANQ